MIKVTSLAIADNSKDKISEIQNFKASENRHTFART